MTVSRRTRKTIAALAIVACVGAIPACRPAAGDFGDGGDQVLVPSNRWVRRADKAQVQDRLEQLTRALERLREETGTPWVGRQDGVTGYLNSLSDGRYRGPGAPSEEGYAEALLRGYGPDLFGVVSTSISFVSRDAPGPHDPARSVVLRAEQRHRNVPVFTAGLSVVIDSEDRAAVVSVRGRVYPDLTVDTEPDIKVDEAVEIAKEVTGSAELEPNPPTLVILPLGTAGSLAWHIIFPETAGDAGSAQAEFFIDAQTGAIVVFRPQPL